MKQAVRHLARRSDTPPAGVRHAGPVGVRQAVHLQPERASLEQVLASALPDEWVLLAGLSPRETVAAAEGLRAHGLQVAVEASDWPALRRALGRRQWDLDCVLLPPRAPSTASTLALRLRDLLAAGVALVVLAPLLVVLALLVKRSSPGPVFFTTQVIGRDGKPFVWRKLRSMRVGAQGDEAQRREQYRALVEGRAGPAPARGANLTARSALQGGNLPGPGQVAALKGGPPTPARGASYKIIDESRVTGIGRFIRRHSLDELPQLWNVLRGEMTLVGPRPCLAYEYEVQAPWHRLRFQVTPGLTGPWQAYGRSQVSFDEMALMDYCYGRARSFWLDARLILRTALIVITGEGGK